MSSNKRAFITGGAVGLGKGIVKRLAQEGYDIAFTYNEEEEKPNEIKREIEHEYGIKAYYFKAEFSERGGESEKVVDKAAEILGGLDLLVNNAGYTWQGVNYIYDMPIEAIDTYLDVNIRTYIINIRQAARYMIKNGIKGNIINISSCHSTMNALGDSVYGATKAALDRAIRTIAMEIAPYGIRINAIMPGNIQVRTMEEERLRGTPEERIEDFKTIPGKIPLGRLGVSEDIGNAVVWLASEKASYITAGRIMIDGGLSLASQPEFRYGGKDDKGDHWALITRKTDVEMEQW